VTDADLSAPIKESDKLLQALAEGVDAAIGSRAVRKAGCDVQQSFKRRLAGRAFNLLVRALALSDCRDTQCGFKCFRREAALKLFGEQRLDGFSFDVEILYLARRRGYRVKEVPVMWREGRESRIRFFRDSLAMAGDLLRIRNLHGN
jgi:dolichyl-phosphate beta-glucosyltransferase